MSKTKNELRNRIARDLGYPLIKIELTSDQIDDAIDDASDKFIKYTAGNATEEQYFAVILSSGTAIYDLPEGVITVIDYSEDSSSWGGVNQLFTVENYLYHLGYIDPFGMMGRSGFISYHLALNFLDSYSRYLTNKYIYRYYSETNQIQVHPTPSKSGEFVLIRSYMLQGSTFSSWTKNNFYKWVYDQEWVRKYATALAKEKMGYIRRKFENFQSIGNVGISLDGQSLIDEAREDKESLDEDLHKKESYEGYGVIVG